MKNNFSSFEKHFKLEMNVFFFLFVISFAVLEIFTILHYESKITDDVKTFSVLPKHKIENISANKRAVQFKHYTSIVP